MVPRRGTGYGQQHKNIRRYITMDNGGEPFAVYQDQNTVRVMALDEDDSTKETLVKTFHNVVKIWLPWHPPELDRRNTSAVVLELGKNQFTFIGERVYSFRLAKGDSVVRFYSDIGPNSVPYPVLLGKKYVYFMLAEANKITMISRAEFEPFLKQGFNVTTVTDKEWQGAYDIRFEFDEYGMYYPATVRIFAYKVHILHNGLQ